MIKNECPRSAILERMGYVAIAEQICGVFWRNFRTLKLYGERNITERAVFFTNGTVNEESQLLLKKEELAYRVHSLLTRMVRHNIRASWLGWGYV
ncbi:hypothetical protein LC605_30515 [Nostoc sp. CHAB 5836]|uniref:hypothetical protein n=1 Tax=Nostoc sp. CHAB 5836 TaxID=2780404 RepID=UPI001E37F86F|nr:hypothetical protein [Nostoc sp. CHAB 5836]MCC5619323.1 hypothetical protein [Nostoc sp. CHAB 5836]